MKDLGFTVDDFATAKCSVANAKKAGFKDDEIVRSEGFDLQNWAEQKLRQ